MENTIYFSFQNSNTIYKSMQQHVYILYKYISIKLKTEQKVITHLVTANLLTKGKQAVISKGFLQGNHFIATTAKTPNV